MLKEEFKIRMKNLLGEEGFSEYEKELTKKARRALRINPIKKPRTLDFETEPIPYCENGFYFECESIGSHPLHHAGAIYVQEPAAMIPVASVDIKPDFKILDTCASPGGKSSQAASFLGENGFIISNEISSSRVKVLSGNLERLGYTNAIVTSTDTKTLTDGFEYFFDLVIVDAPCSGEGMFRKEPDALKDWSVENVRMCAERQKDILQNASRAVKGGGYLLYSTCTFSVEENEEVVNSFLDCNPDFTLVLPNERIIPYTVSGVGNDKMRRFYPHLFSGEGQFVALLKREGDEEYKCTKSSALKELTKEERKKAEEFLSSTLTDFNRDFLFKFKDNIVYTNPSIPVPDKITYSCSVTVGELKKDYIQPHHQFFTALGNKFKRKIDLSLDDVRLSKYLSGESFEYAIENGYAVILADGVALGGGKAVNGVIKNHYPKGLRKR